MADSDACRSSKLLLLALALMSYYAKSKMRSRCIAPSDIRISVASRQPTSIISRRIRMDHTQHGSCQRRTLVSEDHLYSTVRFRAPGQGPACGIQSQGSVASCPALMRTWTSCVCNTRPSPSPSCQKMAASIGVRILCHGPRRVVSSGQRPRRCKPKAAMNSRNRMLAPCSTCCGDPAVRRGDGRSRFVYAPTMAS